MVRPKSKYGEYAVNYLIEEDIISSKYEPNYFSEWYCFSVLVLKITAYFHNSYLAKIVVEFTGSFSFKNEPYIFVIRNRNKNPVKI